MDNHSPKHLIALLLFSILILSLQSCDDQSIQLEKSKVQFSLSPGAASQGRVQDTELPDNARLRISIKSSSGTSILTNHEMQVLKAGSGYTTGGLELQPGTYTITDFMIVRDSEVLNAAPKSASPFGSFVMHSLPYNFSIAESGVANVSMQVLDVRKQKPESFGYASFKLHTVNKLSFIVSNAKGGKTSLKGATAELRLGRYLVKTFPVKPGMNSVVFEGDPDAVYTLSVYAGEAAKVKTFNFRELRAELGAKPLKITLEPALLISMESYVEEGNEYDDYYYFALEGTGSVNINWGDGYEESRSLPFEGEHEYTMGRYTAIVTGDLDQITNFRGFSYGTIMYAITGLTNLTALKTYNPSWGAVPVEVNLSNCENLETIRIEKYGAPDPIDLRTGFQLPEKHFIKEFVFDANEYVGAEVLAIFADNIYNNTVERSIYGGTFFVYAAEAPSGETQQKLDILRNKYNWDVGILLDDYLEAGRTRKDMDSRREKWLRQKFPGSKRILRNARMALN